MPKAERAAGVASRGEKTKGKCPVCGRPRDAHYAPFCSKRCADADLHRWLKGDYVIPGGERVSNEDDGES